MVSIAPIKYISINAASSFELLLLIKYMQKNLLLFLVVTKAHICMILRIKVHTCASESKLLNLIQKSSTFYYAKLMIYRQSGRDTNHSLYIFFTNRTTHTSKQKWLYTHHLLFFIIYIYFGIFYSNRSERVSALEQWKERSSRLILKMCFILLY